MFIGNIQSSDRFIWTVIGDTTSRRADREGCAQFARHADLAIRGRGQPETVHALPL